MCSSSASGDPSNMRKCICTRMPVCPRPAPVSRDTSHSTMPRGRTHRLTERHPIWPTSMRHNQSRLRPNKKGGDPLIQQPESVQTNRATSHGAPARHETATKRSRRSIIKSAKDSGHYPIAYTLIETAKLNGVDPQAWLTDTLAGIADHKIARLDELMPCNYAQT